MSDLASITLAALRGLVAGAPALSGWDDIGQSRIDTFADLADDQQFIHAYSNRAVVEASR